MKHQDFKTVFQKLQTHEISPEEAKELFNSIKIQQDASPRSWPEPDYITAGETDGTKSSGIAIIGIAGQFPDANDTAAFWDNLIQRHDAVRELPAHYIAQDNNLRGNRPENRAIYKWGGVLEERDCFDPLFFNISPREAESMSPHQRLILQESWKALEDAGYNPKSLADSQVGIFIGSEASGYFHESFTGSSDAIIASRLSYYLDLKGPAIIVNTGCSSSGAAIHLACESLRNGETEITLAGGVNANLGQSVLGQLFEIGMLSPTGRCFTFDESADGTVLSEGVGVIVLKRLQDAIAAGDHIYGVIRGSGMNQDGASNGITAPNGLAQEQLITSVYQRYGIDPEEISYIETHGTGTKLGDPVEVNALVRAYKQFTGKEQYCAIGSVKSYIGHTAAASAVIGIIKVLLSMRHHKIPGLRHLEKLNPLIELKGSAFYISTEVLEWRSKNNQPLMAALNSFGHSGTNVHFVIQEYIPPNEVLSNVPIPSNESNPVLVPLSAQNKDRLRDYVSKFAEFLKKATTTEVGAASPLNLAALAYTLQIGRESMEERVVFLVNDIPELITKMDGFLEGREAIDNCWRGQVKQGQNTVHLFISDEDMHEAVQKWIAKGKLRKIAELWTQGFKISWELLYGEIKPRRISLPAYPFARESYRIPEDYYVSKTVCRSAGIVNSSVPFAYAGPLHPLLHQNTSDLSEQRFSSIFTVRSFYWRTM